MALLGGSQRAVSHQTLFNPAGGVRYHLRARRYAKKLWEPFRWSLGEWLLGWEPSESGLLLVGPSGGYNLQPFMFERFEAVTVLEPDPIARWVFERRLSRAPLERRPRLEFIRSDHLVRHPERLLPLLARLGEPALLFSNIVGQLMCLLDADTAGSELHAIRAAVRAALPNRSWLSFHDRLSGPLAPSLDGAVVSPNRWSDAEVLTHAFHTDQALPVELTDHHTEGFFPEDLPHTYFGWQFEPGAHHLIEGVAAVRPT